MHSHSVDWKKLWKDCRTSIATLLGCPEGIGSNIAIFPLERMKILVASSELNELILVQTIA